MHVRTGHVVSRGESMLSYLSVLAKYPLRMSFVLFVPQVLAKYDVVLTTYATLEYEFRSAQASLMVACAYCT